VEISGLHYFSEQRNTRSKALGVQTYNFNNQRKKKLKLDMLGGFGNEGLAGPMEDDPPEAILC
jgi:hypothetical protein